MDDKIKIVTVDGPAGAGKSTVAKRLAQALGFAYLDTGAMYRALTLKAMRNKIALDQEDALVALAQDTSIDLESLPNGVRVFLDGEEVTEAIRTVEVTNHTFYIARAPRIREIMVQWQREMGRKKNVVIEGRDVGTVVFPQAQHKFYLDAAVEERCERRFNELIAKNKKVDKAKLLEEVKERDQKDFTRKVGPLKQADDAVRIDSTGMSIDDVIAAMLRHINPEAE